MNENRDPKVICKIKENEVALPRKTLYLIDKIIRKRRNDGTLKIENQEEIYQELQKRKKQKLDDYEARLSRYENIQLAEKKKRNNYNANFGMTYREWNHQKEIERKIYDFLISEEEKNLKLMITASKQQISEVQASGEDAYAQWKEKKIENKLKIDKKKREERLRKKQENEIQKQTAEE